MNQERARTWAIGLGFLLIGTFGAFLLGRLAANSLVLPVKLTGREARQAPDLVGTRLEEARRKAEDAGAGLDVLGLAFGTEVDSGEVFFQYPPPGLAVEGGKPIEVLVSAGSGSRRVPDVVELPETSALALLEAAGVRLAHIRRVAQGGFEKGLVIATEPPGGALLGADDSLVVLISLGGVTVEVPNVIGKSLQEAGTILEEAQLRIGEARLTGEGAPDGAAESSGSAIVIMQDPPAGGLANAGTAVSLRLRERPSGAPEPE